MSADPTCARCGIASVAAEGELCNWCSMKREDASPLAQDHARAIDRRRLAFRGKRK